jgi:modulator of FtsH protease
VTIAYSASAWESLAVAAATASATLAGLLFIAVSINLQRILEYPSLPARAAQTLILLTVPLVTGIFLLVPGQPRLVLGAELLGTAVLVGGFQLRMEVRTPRSDKQTTTAWILGRVSPPIITCGCLAVAGATVLAGAGGGLYWVVPSVLAAIAFGLLNTWVLLVEILR